jgi:hypothetical protein
MVGEKFGVWSCCQNMGFLLSVHSQSLASSSTVRRTFNVGEATFEKAGHNFRGSLAVVEIC